MQGRGADHAVRESCDRARTGRGTASRRSTSESPPSDEGAGERIRRSVSAVSMATSEYCSCPPRLPTPTASHVAIASGVNHRVTSPRWTSARSYAGQFPTRYFVLYLGCTLDFTSRSCPFGRHDGQGRDEHLLPRTNAPTHRRLRYRGCRKARSRGGWVALHRTGVAPVGRRTKFHDVTASSLPFDQPCLVALRNNARLRRRRTAGLTFPAAAESGRCSRRWKARVGRQPLALFSFRALHDARRFANSCSNPRWVGV